MFVLHLRLFGLQRCIGQFSLVFAQVSPGPVPGQTTPSHLWQIGIF
jgi:hypothetical protein